MNLCSLTIVTVLMLFTTLDSSAETPAENREQQADRLNKEGINAENGGNYENAIHSFQEALNYSTNSRSTAIIKQNLATALSLAGSSAYEHGDYPTAIGLFKQVLELPLVPEDRAIIRYDIGQSYYRRAGAAHRQHDLAEEHDALDAALEYVPSETGQSWLAGVNQQITERSEAATAVRHPLPFETPPAKPASVNTEQTLSALPVTTVAPPPPPIMEHLPSSPQKPLLPQIVNQPQPNSHAAWPGGYWYGRWWPPASYDHPYPTFLSTLPTGTAAYQWRDTWYYYYDNIYYIKHPTNAGYVVTDPPPVSDRETSLPGQGNVNLHIHALNGQAVQQITADRFECHRWAVAQSGVDPTTAASGDRLTSYRRAIEACLDAHGYSVE